MDGARGVPVRDSILGRLGRIVREPFTADTWRRVACAVLALPMGVACVPLALLGAPTGRWQRALLRRFLGAELPPGGSRSGLAHALSATPLNLVCAAVTLYGWSIVPMNLGWPLRAGSDHSHAWGGPTFAGAWAFHAGFGGIGFLLLMPWLGRALAALQLRVARSLLS
ncbi:hypothetical protein [Streptomyces brasiliensis]|uniref:Sensor domain-containing protein n=1 Tax=Streptomyces brasiliensis TaxID=1954 RepID=A0A917KIQ7_9ACTN|nr:hypothetical protein [Streptomyces brasiliensis]GGJ12975.1 hypothetical protein GCM10010121_024180 [Streptomyces brasiliensis]